MVAAPPGGGRRRQVAAGGGRWSGGLWFGVAGWGRRMRIGPEVYARIGATGSAVFARDGRTLFHLRGIGLPQAWALDLATGAARQLTFVDEKLALLRRCPTDDRL